MGNYPRRRSETSLSIPAYSCRHFGWTEGSVKPLPDHGIIADRTHGAFRGMMRDAIGGVSGRVLLGGRSVA